MQANQSGWTFRHWQGDAGEFHQRDLSSERALWRCEVDQPAVVLGSAQHGADIDLARAKELGLKVVTRRSGGGAVYVHPTDCLWLDVVIPRDDDLWTDDVSTSMLWLGDVFVRALSPWVEAETFRGSFTSGEFGRSVCFDSRAPGEVLSGGRKVVGMSQRRGRYGARIQCVLYRAWNPDQWAPIFSSPDVRAHVMAMDVATVDAPLTDLAAAVYAELPPIASLNVD